MSDTKRAELLSYRSISATPLLPGNKFAVVAFVSAMIFSPFLRLAVSWEPFWGGHPLHFIRAIVEAVPVLLLPMPGVLLGVCALVYAERFHRRRGLAVAATLIGIAWYILLGALGLLMAFLLPNFAK